MICSADQLIPRLPHALTVASIERKSAMPAEPGGYMKMSVVGQLNGLIAHFMTLEQVDTIVLPMPYNQLLKLILIFWTFTLPFVIVQETGWFCPYAPRLTEHCS